MRVPALAAGILALALSACATVGSVFDSGAENRYDAGMRALAAGDYVTANRELGFVAERYGSEPIGRQALLVVSALEMDPRNPNRRLALGSELSAAYLRLKGVPEWTGPLAQTLYLLSLELGAAEERAAQAEADKAAAEQRADILPKLPEKQSTVPARMNRVEAERDKLAKRVEALEAQVADRDKKIAEKDKELERIRKTLKS